MATDNLSYKGYTGSVECSLEDGCLHGRVLFVDDLVTYEADTVPELVTSFQAALDRYLSYCERTGKAANKAYSGSFNVRPGPELHKSAVQAAQKQGISLNDFVARALQAAVSADRSAKVEHIHQVTLTFTGATQTETRVATTGIPTVWEQANASIQ